MYKTIFNFILVTKKFNFIFINWNFYIFCSHCRNADTSSLKRKELIP